MFSVKPLNIASFNQRQSALTFGTRGTRENSVYQKSSIQIAASYKKLIESGELPKGSIIENITAITKKLQVSRPVVHEAFGQLIKEGYLVLENKGKYVVIKEASQPFSDKPLSASIPDRPLTVTEQAVNNFKAKVNVGELPTGFCIKNQETLAKTLGISRPVLKASIIKQLETDGFLEEIQRGIFIITSPAEIAKKREEVVTEIKQKIESGEIALETPLASNTKIKQLMKDSFKMLPGQVYKQLEAEGYLIRKANGTLYIVKPLPGEEKQLLQDISIGLGNFQWLQQEAEKTGQELGAFLNQLINTYRHWLKVG